MSSDHGPEQFDRLGYPTLTGDQRNDSRRVPGEDRVAIALEQLARGIGRSGSLSDVTERGVRGFERRIMKQRPAEVKGGV
ncbi:hypothetical protein ABT124_49140 [Streptomyces sp. NPDC001982]|uniref:hypothetical protein n=1 Tax=Streptomyces sp. NPDC001982 TaxID=3154405 RepID=UPI00331EA8DD